mmetsp:Transcript_10582/g.31213  ORF Transcript_10582/g.31213 Transcript_10582/m.31213 type:complete len:360 (-) Transcript_10582:691-1770(-)
MRSCPIAIQFLPLAVLLAATASAPTSASGFSLLRPPRTSAISATCDARAFGGAVNHGIRFRFDGRRGNALLPSHARRDDAFDAAASSDAEGGIFRGGGTTTKTAIGKFATFAEKNFFLLGMVVAVTLARVFPSVGMNGGVLRPELFIGKIGVTCIFLISGLSLQLSELADAVTHFKLNSLVQLAIFGAWPALVGVPLTRILRSFLPGLLPPSILDGLLILSCLPTTVNMCILLTSASGGNVASALSNAVISNVLGIFATPALLLRFFGENIELPFGNMILKLCNKVLLPVAVGQALRTTPAKELYTQNSKKFKRLQEVRTFFFSYFVRTTTLISECIPQHHPPPKHISNCPPDNSTQYS